MNFTHESFDNWKKGIPSKLKLVTEDFAKESRLKLDFTIKSLDDLEKWILSNYDVAADLRDEPELLDSLALYVGETYIRHIGGYWFVDFENEKSVYYQKLVMKAEGGDDFYRSSQALCTSCISRKKGNLISSTLEKSIDYLNL